MGQIFNDPFPSSDLPGEGTFCSLQNAECSPALCRAGTSAPAPLEVSDWKPGRACFKSKEWLCGLLSMSPNLSGPQLSCLWDGLIPDLCTCKMPSVIRCSMILCTTAERFLKCCQLNSKSILRWHEHSDTSKSWWYKNMHWMFALELMTEGDGPHIQLSAQCLAQSHHPVNGSQMGLHLLYCLLFIVSPPELPPPSGVSPQCPAPVSTPGHLPASLPASPSPLPPLRGAASPQARTWAQVPSEMEREKKYDFKSSRGSFLFLYFWWACQTPTCSLKVRTLAGSAGEPSALQSFCSWAKLFFLLRQDHILGSVPCSPLLALWIVGLIPVLRGIHSLPEGAEVKFGSYPASCSPQSCNWGPTKPILYPRGLHRSWSSVHWSITRPTPPGFGLSALDPLLPLGQKSGRREGQRSAGMLLQRRDTHSPHRWVDSAQSCHLSFANSIHLGLAHTCISPVGTTHTSESGDARLPLWEPLVSFSWDHRGQGITTCWAMLPMCGWTETLPYCSGNTVQETWNVLELH